MVAGVAGGIITAAVGHLQQDIPGSRALSINHHLLHVPHMQYPKFNPLTAMVSYLSLAFNF